MTAAVRFIYFVFFLFMASAPPLSARQHDAGLTPPADAGTAGSPQQDGAAERQEEQPPQGGVKEWIARRLEGLTSPSGKSDNTLSFSAGIIVAGSGLSGGVGYRRLNAFGRRIGFEVDGNVSLRLYQEYRAAIGRLDARASTLELAAADRKVTSLYNASSPKAPGSALYVDLRYRDYRQHTHYGTGINSLEGDRADYTLRGVSVDGVWQRQITSRLGVSARGGLLDLELGPGHNDSIVNVQDRFSPAVVPGVGEQPRFITFGVGLVHDTRQEPQLPVNGRMIGISLRRFAATSMPELAFTRVAVDARGYRLGLSSRDVIAVRGLISNDFTRDDGSTPFYLQQSLGGSDTLRGYHSYRFQDHTLMHGTIEYRWRVHRFMEIVPFFDAGTVAPGLSRLSFGSLKTSPGVGIRGRNSRRSIGRLDWAWSKEGQRLVFDIGPAF
jgi:outer membrane protein assembly factor BamA